ncbi:maltodextrin glucosidase [compost metagenome]
MLEHYRRFLSFRRKHPAFAKGGIEFQPVEGDVLSYTRTLGNETVLCLFNLSATPAKATLPEGNWEVLEGHGFANGVDGRSVELPAWGAFFARYA